MSRWIAQPDKQCCGQIAVAIVANISLKESIEIFGHDSYTSTKDIVHVLKFLGFICNKHLKRKRTSILCIAKVWRPEWKQNWHWVVLKGNKIYDGVYGDKTGKAKWPVGAKITSCLNIWSWQNAV